MAVQCRAVHGGGRSLPAPSIPETSSASARHASVQRQLSMRRGLQIAMVAVGVALASTPSAQAQSCSVAPNTLTLDCGNACGSYKACMLASNSTAAACDLECFDNVYPFSIFRFTFLIPFGAYKSPQELADGAAWPAENATDPKETLDTAFKSNDDLTKIAKLTLSTSTSFVTIAGGKRTSESVKGRVADVEIVTNFITDNTRVENLQLVNLNLAKQIDALAANFPSRLWNILLVNCLITEFPAGVANLKEVRSVDLTYNYITTVNENHDMSHIESLYLGYNSISTFTGAYAKMIDLSIAYNSLTTTPLSLAKSAQLEKLDLSGNKISEMARTPVIDTLQTLKIASNGMKNFTAYFPALTTLNLTDNSFTEIPAAIYNHVTLEALYIDQNPLLKDVKLTNAQANFFFTLKKFSGDTTLFSTDCDATQQVVVQQMIKEDFSTIKFTACITDGPVNMAVINGTRAPATAPPTLSPTSSSSSGSKTSDTIDSTSAAKSGGSNMVAIILGSVAGILVVALIVLFFLWKTRNDEKTELNTEGSDSSAGDNMNKYTALWNDPVLLAVKINSDDIQDVKKIGQGAFADVWLVNYRGSQQLASKRLIRDKITRARTKGFIEEIKLVASLKHPSIVEFIGAAWTKEADLQALFEFMDGGDLRSYLVSEHTQRQWTLEKVQIAIDIVEALVYVHSFNPPLLHRDLKSRNILLSEANQAKLTDFGVSRYQSEQHTMTAGVGTGCWLAPEVISGQSDYGPAADIFSFGVVLSELDSHKLPYDGVRGPDGYKLVDIALLHMVSAGELKPTFLATCPATIAGLADRCLALLPENRPTAIEIAYALREFKKETY